MTISRFNFKSFMIALFVAAPLFTACKDNATTTEETINTPQEATLEQKKQALKNVAPTQTTTQTTTNGSGAINPAHGQPGHDCAIPVGAPLNGSAATPATTPTQTINLNDNNSSPVKASSGSGAINPAHGQPGHNCAVPVGAPL